MEDVVKVYDNGTEIGLILRSSYHGHGISFFSGDNDALQLGYMNRPDEYVIVPHIHNSIKREVYFTEEILFIRSGVVRIDFYDAKQAYIESYIAYAGDVVVLKGGGHGMKILERSEIFEVKQGPYLGLQDKVRFETIDDNKVVIK